MPFNAAAPIIITIGGNKTYCDNSKYSHLISAINNTEAITKTGILKRLDSIFITDKKAPLINNNAK